MTSSHPGRTLMSNWGEADGLASSSSASGTGHWGFLGDEDGATGGQAGAGERDGRRLGGSVLPPSAAAGSAAALAAQRRSDAAMRLQTRTGGDHPNGTTHQTEEEARHGGGLSETMDEAGEGMEDMDWRAFEHRDGATELAEAAVRRLEEESDGEPMSVSG